MNHDVMSMRKDLEGSSPGLIEILAYYLLEGLIKTTEKLRVADDLTKI